MQTEPNTLPETEQLIWGYLGNGFIAFGFALALLSVIAFILANRSKEDHASWSFIGTTAFGLHALFVAGIAGTLLYLLFNHRFEYHYVFWHSNREMQMKYILSCLWEGQEGSFLLWTFWHCVLGVIILFRKDEWKAPVMAVIASVQVFLLSMLFGIWIGDYKIGSNPFLLLKHHPDFMSLPFLTNPNYVQLINGRGLNPLLQNYWMTIHPPTLFLGFASTVIPFAFAVSGLWNRKFQEWLKPALPWAFFAIMVLGTGILMGGAWAYEALSFGGFWAWDPVENASLVPWITLVAAAHVMLIYRNKGQSLVMAFVLCIATFVLILYSTFLTRSGILGDTSVHAFTDLGMSGQLLVYLFFYLIGGYLLLAIRFSQIPYRAEEEKILSREFWMYVGALILSVSAFQISFSTSIPVINKVFGTNLAPPIEAIAHYNSWQLPIASAVALLIGFTQFLKYKNSESETVKKLLVWPVILTIVASGTLAVIFHITELFYLGLLLTSVWAIVGNGVYWAKVLAWKSKTAGASVAHIGFGLILLGALISNAKQQVISTNTSGYDTRVFGESLKNNENILLHKNDTLQLADYHVVYKGRRKEGINIFYDIDYFMKKENSFEPLFTLSPRVQLNERMGNVAEPDTKHFLHKDVYTHITYDDFREERAAEPDKFIQLYQSNIKPGDTLFARNSILIFNGFNTSVDKSKWQLAADDIAVQATFTALDIRKNSYTASPIYAVSQSRSQAISIADTLQELGLRFEIMKLHPENGTVEVNVSERNANQTDFIIMKAIVFPGINILWLGCFVMVVGTLMAIYRRLT